MSDQDYENTIAHLDERIAELRLEIIAATGQAQTALEDNAKLREALKVRREEAKRKHAYQLELEAENAKLKEALGHIADMRVSEHRKVAIARETLLEGER